MRILEQTVSLRSSLKEDQLRKLMPWWTPRRRLPGCCPRPRCSGSGISFRQRGGAERILQIFLRSLCPDSQRRKIKTRLHHQYTAAADGHSETDTIAVNKQNYTHDMIVRTGVFNVSILTESVPFKIFSSSDSKRQGYRQDFCGRSIGRTANGLTYLSEYATL